MKKTKLIKAGAHRGSGTAYDRSAVCVPGDSSREDGQTRIVRKLYGTIWGRLVLAVITRPWVSGLAGRFMDSGLSTVLIRKFIRANNIDMKQYEKARYRSFNDFFKRKIKSENRPVAPQHNLLPAPCDGMLSVHRIDRHSRFSIKGNRYTMAGLLGSNELADRYNGGTLLVFRLTVSDYHRYHYPDSGSKSSNVRIPGVLHTVHPIAAGRRAIYCENAREYFHLYSDNFGDMLYMQVGALLVGRICNNHQSAVVTRGEEAGCFEYGGSTVILCLEPDVVELYSRYTEVGSDEEVRVRMGEAIGEAVYI